MSTSKLWECIDNTNAKLKQKAKRAKQKKQKVSTIVGNVSVTRSSNSSSVCTNPASAPTTIDPNSPQIYLPYIQAMRKKKSSGSTAPAQISSAAAQAQAPSPAPSSPWGNRGKMNSNVSKRKNNSFYSSVTSGKKKEEKKVKSSEKSDRTSEAKKKYDKEKIISAYLNAAGSKILEYKAHNRNIQIVSSSEALNVIKSVWKENGEKKLMDVETAYSAVNILVKTDFVKSVSTEVDSGLLQSTVPLSLIRKLVDPTGVLSKTNCIAKLSEKQKFVLGLISIPNAYELLI